MFGPVGVVLLAVLAVAAAAAGDRLLRRPETGLIALVVGLEGFSLLGDVVETWQGTGPDSAPAILGPLGTGATLLVALLVVARPARDRGDHLLWGAAMVYVGASLFTSLLAGSGLPQPFVEMGIVLSALFVVRRLDVPFVVDVLKVTVGAVLVLSLLLLAVGAPGASEEYSSGWLPMLSFRVSGVTAHANALGPLCVVYAILEYVHPSPRRVRTAMLGVAAVLLVLAQSKTAWVGAAFALAAVAFADERRRRAAGGLVALAAVAIAGVALLGVSVEDVVPADEVEEVGTLTGRTAIWALGVDAWRDSDLLVGGGYASFGEVAERAGHEWAAQAHNQLVQTVAEHGLVGLAGLLVYVAAMVVVSWRLASATRFASVALVGALLLRGMTETPIDQLSLQHVVTYVVLLAFLRDRAGPASFTPSAGPPAAARAGTDSRRTPATAGRPTAGRTAPTRVGAGPSDR